MPIPEIQYLAYLHNAEDQLRGEAATLSFFSNGQYRNPMVVRIAGLAYQRGFGGHFHNDNAVAVLRDIPGLVIACPARGDDAASMLRTCVAAGATDGTVSVFLEPIALYHQRDLHAAGDNGWLFADDGAHVPIGRGRVYGDGTDLAIVTFGNGLPMSLRAAAQLALAGRRSGCSTFAGWRRCRSRTLMEAAHATGRVLVADETRASAGVGEGVIASTRREWLQWPDSAGGQPRQPRTIGARGPTRPAVGSRHHRGRLRALVRTGWFGKIQPLTTNSREGGGSEVDHVAGDAVHGFLMASLRVGWAWMLRETSVAVRSHCWARVSSGSSSTTSGPIMWAPRNSPCSASAMILTKPPGSPRPCALRVGLERELRHLDVVAALARLGLGVAEAGDLRLAVRRPRHHRVVDRHRLGAGDRLGRDDAHRLGVVGEHQLRGHVADREDAGHVGAHVVVDRDRAAVGERDAGGFEPEAVGTRGEPDRLQDLVGLQDLLLVALGDGDLDLVVRCRRSSRPGSRSAP